MTIAVRRARYLGLLVLALLCLRASSVAAGEPTLADLLDRVPAQRVNDPFATMTLGVELSTLLPFQSQWAIPTAGGGFASARSSPLSEGALHIGGLHFFGHLELAVDIPLVALQQPLTTTPGAARSVMAAYGVTVGAKYYPWALAAGTVRPFLSTGVMQRALRVTDGPDPSANPTGDTRWVLPVGLGVAWRTPWHLLVDASVEYRLGDVAPLASGVVPQVLGQPVPAYATRDVDLSGLRFILGIKADFDGTFGIVKPGFRERVANELAQMWRRGTLSTFYLAAGPSTRVFDNPSAYFSSDRPYLRGVYGETIFPSLGLGYYNFAADLDVRLGYREFGGSASAFGASLSTYQRGGFLEALKIFDLHFYGFAPFVGLGAGYEWVKITDNAAGAQTTATGGVPVVSVPFGWDIRINPSDCWFLRTNLRWVPVASFSPPRGHAFDYGGLELDFIQIVFFPDRVFRPAP